MELGWSALALLCLGGALAWFWQDSLGAREHANAAAIEACTRLGLQFLDGTVAFARLSLTRELGRLRLRRTYVFDYTADSIERRQGFVVLTGQRVDTVGYAPGEARRGPAALARPDVRHAPLSSASLQASHRNPDAQVLNLQDWRARRRTSPEAGPSPAGPEGGQAARPPESEDAPSGPDREPDHEPHREPRGDQEDGRA